MIWDGDILKWCYYFLLIFTICSSWSCPFPFSSSSFSIGSVGMVGGTYRRAANGSKSSGSPLISEGLKCSNFQQKFPFLQNLYMFILLSSLYYVFVFSLELDLIYLIILNFFSTYFIMILVRFLFKLKFKGIFKNSLIRIIESPHRMLLPFEFFLKEVILFRLKFSYYINSFSIFISFKRKTKMSNWILMFWI